MLRARQRTQAPLGSPILGSHTQDPLQLRWRIQILGSALLLGANIFALAIAIAVAVAIPGPILIDPKFNRVNFVLFPTYIAAIALVCLVGATLLGLRWLEWAIEGRRPTLREQLSALGLPWRITMVTAAAWTAGTAIYAYSIGEVDRSATPKAALTGAFVGSAATALTYLLAEFIFRPIAARAMEHGDPRQIRYAGVTRRMILVWLLGSALPATALIIIAVFYFTRPVDATQLASTMVVLGGIILVFGVLLTTLGAQATVSPIKSVIQGMRAIESDEEDAHVVVYDGTELGELQAGFNRMADGLRERERIRELFGRHVGREVAEAAMRQNPELGGEERSVAVFFIDIVGSTSLAFTRPPKEVVALLNRFFDVVVDEVDRNGGLINKFEGDAALAIFGAPVDLVDAAGQALTAARTIRRRLIAELPECEAAIGVAFGIAVAGNIGARKRFEYTVIGDPINEAARLCELAKTVPSMLLASGPTLEDANPAEATFWRHGDCVTLRGRDAPTQLVVPAD
ncbi:adenylate/guanylate cyclase domain-containing protein [Antrihabitans sp. YC2-6]|uniref:adenylate/guanylate cyclase domain-containing protein n=1 Tax=Antrihabitans sp. YC2-6 TaxID=2799498 RepID=UPI0018F7B404|nr:adenylate/guanylate cyclase domain-containing protein [Antrihabitans sp. YC2-6]MBJ8346589.1 adenylate/guanylate cyclase domain-containing protein [Antrihabitans sp. YC2-6]